MGDGERGVMGGIGVVVGGGIGVVVGEATRGGACGEASAGRAAGGGSLALDVRVGRGGCSSCGG